MKKYLPSVILSVGILISPVFTQAAALSDVQIQSILSLLSAFGAENTIIANVKVALAGGTPSTTSSSATILRGGVQPESPANKHRICSVLYRNLSQGIQGGDVQGLQEFLGTEGYFSANATGYFGPVTAQAVAKWQESQGVERIGIVGPMTRERIKMWCIGQQNWPPQTGTTIPHMACTKEYNPVCGSKPIVCITTPCNPIQQTYGNRCMMVADGATFVRDGQCENCIPRPACLDATPRCLLPEPVGGWCPIHPSTNKPPIIFGFSGPTVLAVNTSGTWKIKASDPENQQLSYHVNWGDEYTKNSDASATVMTDAFIQTTTFTHAYSTAGVYTVTIVVRDSAGGEAKTSTTVKVGIDGTACTTEYTPVCGQPKWSCTTSLTSMSCATVMPAPKTYSNRCMMNADGADFLYEGQCRV